MKIKDLKKFIKKQPTNWIYVGVFVVFAIIIGIVIWAGFTSSPEEVSTEVPNKQSIEEQKMQANEQAATQNQTAPSVTQKAPVAMTYSELVNEYSDRRIQFSNCSATPSYFTVKSGTEIMIDSRNDAVTKIIMDNYTHTLPAYGYKIVTLTTDVSHTVKVSCELAGVPRYNVAEILIQP